MMDTPYFSIDNLNGIKHLLFCIPYGGGWSTIFASWSLYIDDSVCIIPISLPGRGIRMDEESFFYINDFVNDLSPYLEKVIKMNNIPFSFYGGCFGGLCSYELLKHLKSNYSLNANYFFTNSLCCPTKIKSEEILSKYDDDELSKKLVEKGELPEVLLSDNEVLQFLLPGIRADYKLYENYEFKKGCKLNTSLLFFENSYDEMDMNKNVGWENLINGKISTMKLNYSNLFELEAQKQIAIEINKVIKEA